MRIYKEKYKNSFLALDLDKQLVSTRSSYPDSFFSSLDEKHYQFFKYSYVGVKSADKEKVIFFETEGDEFTGAQGSPEEIYSFIGNAETTEKLEKLLKKYEEIESKNELILEDGKIEYMLKKWNQMDNKEKWDFLIKNQDMDIVVKFDYDSTWVILFSQYYVDFISENGMGFVSLLDKLNIRYEIEI